MHDMLNHRIHSLFCTLTIRLFIFPEDLFMSTDFIFRLIGMIVFAIIGAYWGASLSEIGSLTPDQKIFTPEQYAFTIGLVGALAGLILTPYLTTRPIAALRGLLARVAAQSLFASLVGLIAGLIVAALLAYPLSSLPEPFGNFMPFVGVLVCGYLGVAVFVTRQNDLFHVISSLTNRGGSSGQSESDRSAALNNNRTILLDTSVIIDGRVLDIARSGFVHGTLLIPRFVLNELQYIADSVDGLRRQRGRRGLEVLAHLQKEPAIVVQISDIDVEGVREVDDKLVILARQMRCPILTNDYNLNRVAELQGVTIMNTNELANAVKSVVLPGELLHIRVIQEGKEASQGVGYMDDGTMVVIESGNKYIDKDISVVVTKVLQTAAGKMIFARPE
jgi:uncharacterized protein YacL